MLSKPVENLILEIGDYIGRLEGDNEKKIIQENPEAWLVSLLKQIKEYLPIVGVTLYGRVHMAAYKVYIEKAKEELSESEK